MCFAHSLSSTFYSNFSSIQFKFPIFLTGLPPQGFRRLWKARENSSSEKLTKVNSMTQAYREFLPNISIPLQIALISR